MTLKAANMTQLLSANKLLWGLYCKCMVHVNLQFSSFAAVTLLVMGDGSQSGRDALQRPLTHAPSASMA